MASPFGSILVTPETVLRQIGASEGAVDASLETTSVGEPVECFQVTGSGGHVEWCFSADGLLLSFLRGSATDGWTSLEAVSVSREVA